jgi:nucleoside-diphosphate-sugar epimerase
MFKRKNILITGGAGALGQELTKQILALNPGKIVVYSRDDNKHAMMESKFNDDRIRYIIGDVRDYDRLQMACRDIDIIIHCAALKHVDRGEYNLIEYKSVIVDGAENIIKVCINTPNIKKVVALSTDKACLYGDCLVDIDKDNNPIKISRMVNNKYNKTVKSYDENTGKIVNSKVYNWYRNLLENRELYYVSYENAQYYGKNRTCLIGTEDHPILTTDGWKRLDELKETNYLITAEDAPNEKQEAFIIGTLLGDGNLTNIYKKTRGECQSIINCRSALNLQHGKLDKSWLELKLNILKDFKNSGINEIKHIIDNINYPQYSVQFNNSAYFTKLFKIFYDKEGKKHIPIDLVCKYLDKYPEILLATWFQDDGCKSYDNIRLATHSFNKNEVEEIIKKLCSIGLECYIAHPKYKTSIYNEIRFTVKGTEKFFNLTSKYILLRRKIPNKFNNNDYTENLWNLGEPIRYITSPIIKKVDKDILNPIVVFCLDVENTHNFIVANMIVHNCAPRNLYGAAKLMSDKMFVAANRVCDTKFSVIRYGNVINSTGSLLTKVTKGEPMSLTHADMTRFWIPLDYASKLVLFLCTNMRGGEIFIPKIPCCKVSNFLIKQFGKCEFNIIGIRPGEKLHESMFLKSDCMYMLEFKYWYLVYPYIPEVEVFGGYVGSKFEPFDYTSENVTNMDWLVGIDSWLTK